MNKTLGNVTLTNLTSEQCFLLDQMWEIESRDELDDWKENLSLRQRQLVDSLIVVLLLEHMDKIIDQDKEYIEAKEVIGKFRLH